MPATTLAALAAVLLAQAPGSPRDAPRVIRVSGQGRAFAAPDVSRVILGVEVDAVSLARATADATARMKGVLAALEKAGVAAKDVQTVRYDVDVKRKVEKVSGPGEPSGYRVSNRVRVTVRDMARVGAILDQAVAAGANDVGGLSFDKEDASGERARALEAAVADARAKAATIAKAAGVALGEVLSLSESTPGAIPVRVEGFDYRARASVPVATGQLEIPASVDVTFALR
ncbi:MAG TPA: SIMPL domain-containing protein [Anaeromyxobacteraceae bacterium]|nr:SIMPL domain-containing protein [Anaeromyxobacteraceae bacterium]